MRKITDLRFENAYAELPPEFYQKKDPLPFQKPHMVAFNGNLATELGVDPGEGQNPLAAEYLCGKRSLAGADPLAMYYAGWQFGVYNPHLGDGRALLLGQIIDERGRRWDLHLKGCGATRFSRGFDGRATLKSSIREYLGSEALHHLGIPSTRALCIVGSTEKIERETKEPAAMMLRVAETHVRFGSFEGFYHLAQEENIQTLADYVIARHYPEIPRRTKEGYGLFLRAVAEKTASTIAKWQAFGFTHGVMNTDNMSITGLTLDYGPYGFLETFDRDYVPNHSDHFGRYSYVNQPAIARWNLEKLIKCLDALVDEKQARDAIEVYNKTFSAIYRELMLRKFGLEEEKKESLQFIEKTLGMLAESDTDYHIFLRNISDIGCDGFFGENSWLKELSETSEKWRQWFSEYAAKLRENSLPDRERKKLMDSVNPKYILRNYLMETAIKEALERENYSEIEKVRKIFENPFSDQPEHESYAAPSPEWAKDLVVSCLS
ncbi:MAG: YdiU family protein [Candidatus Dadabacteria bacterium]|nr:YdiU family protein [Candidatus Dadabacteria bacterium]